MKYKTVGELMRDGKKVHQVLYYVINGLLEEGLKDSIEGFLEKSLVGDTAQLLGTCELYLYDLNNLNKTKEEENV